MYTNSNPSPHTSGLPLKKEEKKEDFSLSQREYPKGEGLVENDELKALVFDSQYDAYR